METNETTLQMTQELTSSLPQNYRDVSNQDLFKNHVLCAQFLRDYSNCKALAHVQPEDIEDISERFTSMMGTKVEGDTVKRIRLKDAKGREMEVYAVSLIEHKNDVDYDVVMQLLHYISNIWRDYARSRQYQTEGGNTVEANKTKSFRYPPVLPIVYYEGKRKWTAGMHLRDRIQQVEGLEEFIPDFAYRLVRIHDYSNTDLLNKADETKELLSQIKEGRNMGYLFENMEHMDIQAERQGRVDAEKERDEANRKLNDMEKRLNNTEDKLDEAHKNYLRLCKKCSLDKENAVTELLKDDTLTQENAWEIVNRYWDML